MVQPAMWKSPVWCGIDIGTTNVKVLLLSGDGTVLWRESRPTPRVSDGIGPCTDADNLVDAIEAMMISAHKGAGLDAPLAGICVDGVGEDGLTLDAAFKPSSLAIPWNDRRADVQASMMAGMALWRDAQLPVAVDGTRTAAKWAWLKQERPHVLADARCWVALADYPAVRWTGRSFMSATLAARTACYDIVASTWLLPLLQDTGAPPLPEVLVAGTVIGSVSSVRLQACGLVSGETQVMAGGHDHPMAASVVCLAQPGAVIDSMGTAELLYFESRTWPVRSARLGFAASTAILGDGTAWLDVMELSKHLAVMLGADHPCRLAFAAVMRGEPVTGSLDPDVELFRPWQDDVANLPPGRTADEWVRQVLEGCALYTRYVLEQAAVIIGSVDAVFVTGGWASSSSMMQLRAAVLGVDLHVIEEPQLAALGSAGLAAWGCTGVMPQPDLAETIYAPDPEAARVYDAIYRRFRLLAVAGCPR